MKKIVIFVLISIFLTFTLTSCDEFYSKSLGKDYTRTYDPAKIDVKAGNVNEWIEACIGNPGLAEVVGEKIANELGRLPPESDEKAILLAGGIEIALEASGLGVLLITNALDALSDIDQLTVDSVQDILKKIEGGFNNKASVILADMINACLKSGQNNGEIPRFEDAFAEIASPADIAESCLVLILGLIHEKGETLESVGDDWNDIVSLTEGLTINGSPPRVMVNSPPAPSPTALALAACLNLIADAPNSKFRDNPLTDEINNAFFDH